MFTEAVVTGVAGRVVETVVSGVCFLRGPSGGLRRSRSEALRLRAEGGVVVLGRADLALMTRPGCAGEQARVLGGARGTRVVAGLLQAAIKGTVRLGWILVSSGRSHEEVDVLARCSALMVGMSRCGRRTTRLARFRLAPWARAATHR